MLTLIPKNPFSWDFHVLEGGRELTLIDRHWVRERGEFSLDGTSWSVRRTSVLQGTFVLEQEGRVVAEARKPSSLRRRFEVSVGSRQFSLEPTSFLARAFRLHERGTPVGEVRRTGLLRRNATAEFEPAIPREVQLFVVFLVLLLWKRASDSATAGGAS